MNVKCKVACRLLLVLFFVYLFLLSIGLLSAAFKGFGKGFAENLIATTSNPFTGLMIGIFATCLVQSSSTTTSIVVGIVGAGGLSIANAIPIIMGANIGTTVTNTLVSLGHVGRKEEFRRAIAGATVHDFFNLICVAVMFPLQLATNFLGYLAHALDQLFENVGGMEVVDPIKTITKPVIQAIHDLAVPILAGSDKAAYIFMLILSIVLLFLALYFIVRIMRSLVVGRAEIVLNNLITRNAFLALLAGMLFTFVVQSSSITTSLMIPMVAAGIFTVEGIFPITMGANIGTTGTAILASFATGNPAAVTIAFVHFLFNAIGVIFFYPIPAVRAIPIRLAHALGNLAAERRRYAFLYVFGLFFILPALMIFLSRLFQ